MRLVSLLQKMFSQARTKIDDRLYNVILEAAAALSKCKHLSIAGIGRTLERATTIKHNIKTVDRLFGNKKLQSDRVHFYRSCAEWLIGHNKRPIIIVDWSGLTHCGEYHFLRASVPTGGRALPILDIAFHIKEYGSHESHKKFLSELRCILPKDCKPIIVSDSGFRCPWFKCVISFGWDFLGRVRHQTQFLQNESRKWLPVKSLYQNAQTHSQYLFQTQLAKSNPVSCHFHIMKEIKTELIKT